MPSMNTNLTSYNLCLQAIEQWKDCSISTGELVKKLLVNMELERNTVTDEITDLIGVAYAIIEQVMQAMDRERG